MPTPYQYLVTLHGETIDGTYDLDDARALRAEYVTDVWTGRLPDLLTAEDFASRAECDAAFGVVALYDDGRTTPVA